MSRKLTKLSVLEHIPVLPLRDVVVYPHMIIPLFIGRASSVQALEESLKSSKQILLVTQKDAGLDNPTSDQLFKIGTLANILQVLKLPDGTVKVLVEGIERYRVVQYIETATYFFADIQQLNIHHADKDLELLSRTLIAAFDQYVKLNKKIPIEILSSVVGLTDYDRLTDLIAAHLPLKINDKQQLLEIDDVKDRMDQLLSFVQGETDVLQTEQKIRERVRSKMEKTQREFYLNEQMKVIQDELQGLHPDHAGAITAFEQKIKDAQMSAEAEKKALTELSKLKMMPAMSAEATVLRNYLDWLLDVPWHAMSPVNEDLKHAESILNKEHYGLEKIKERILEYLAVQIRVKKNKSPILCFVGPPGVGKTSLGQSIANATGRQFVRLALGGVRDEAEIRGHRRTYIGALPGKIIQKLAKAGVRNPLFMLDEIDKMAMDFRGDPASALLEVLDPEQNHTFGDHYLEVDYDLSDVMFIATANTLDIPPALADRMEIIRLSGYTENEKLKIAEQHLIPKQMKLHGLVKKELKFNIPALRGMIQYYTREAGVRNLEREISKVCRKTVKELLTQTSKTKTFTINNIKHYLGVRRFSYGLANKKHHVGQVTGLAWTQVGGELLHIEAVVTPGKGKATITGQLGQVMQESISAAMTVVRANSKRFDISDKFFDEHDIHVHVPEGAIPKDGPSAGIGMCTALLSAIKNIPVFAHVAMTGEITLRGEVLPIGGLKEKLFAAKRGGIKIVLIPKENEKDLEEVPQEIKKGLKIRSVDTISDVWKQALTTFPERSKKRRNKKI